MLRLSSISKLKYIDEILAGWRLHGRNASLEKPFLFIEEKETWFKKVIKSDAKILKKYSTSVNKFQKSLFRQKSFIFLLEGQRIKAFKLILKTKLTTIKDIIVFIAIISFLHASILRKIYLTKLKKI